MVQDIPSLQYVYFWNSVEMEVAASLQLLHVKAFLRFSLRHGFSHLAMQNHLTQSWQRWWTPSLKEAGPESLCGLQWILGRSWRLQRLHCLGMWVKFLIQYGWWLCLKLCTLGFTSMHLPLAIQCYTGIPESAQCMNCLSFIFLMTTYRRLGPQGQTQLLNMPAFFSSGKARRWPQLKLAQIVPSKHTWQAPLPNGVQLDWW